MIQAVGGKRALRENGLSLNLAIGPSCFVQCRGCYNRFGTTGVRGGLVSRREIAEFVEGAVDLGVRQVTVSGGDPLTHPEIQGILFDLRRLGVYVKLDTVGTAFLRDAHKIFYGHGVVSRIPIESVVDYVDMIGFPLDGVSQRTQDVFRRPKRPKAPEHQEEWLFPRGDLGLEPEGVAEEEHGDAAIERDTPALVKLFKDTSVKVCVNTVVHAQNLHELRAMALLVNEIRPDIWQLFEFMPDGSLGRHNRNSFELRARDYQRVVQLDDPSGPQTLFDVPHRDPFDRIMDAVRAAVTSDVQVQAKSRRARESIYFLVNDAGIAWQPQGNGSLPTVIGHIADDREGVLATLGQHLAADASQ